eukprot:1506891-Pleurochrysis_carterae.AAC.1
MARKAGISLPEGSSRAALGVAYDGGRRGIDAFMPTDGQVHLTQCLQTHGMHGGDRVRYEFKVMTAAAV